MVLRSIPSRNSRTDGHLSFKERHTLSETLARRGKRRAVKTTMLQHPKIIQNVSISWEGLKRVGLLCESIACGPAINVRTSVSKVQLAIDSGLHFLFCGELCQSESKHHRHHGKCGEVFRRHKDQRLLTRHGCAVAFCVLTGTGRDALRRNAEIARELDMWALATRGMHLACTRAV